MRVQSLGGLWQSPRTRLVNRRFRTVRTPLATPPRAGPPDRANRPTSPEGWAGGPDSLVSWPMAHNPQSPQGPQGHDPAGSTQMFRAFVDEPGPAGQQTQATQSSGPRVGLIVGVIAVVAILAAVGWLAFS